MIVSPHLHPPIYISASSFAFQLGFTLHNEMPAPTFLASLIPQNASPPHITLTYAQSLDARIAGPGGRQIQLSGEESMLMTHWCVLLALCQGQTC